ncbi:hypothetical protein Tco_0481001 [Tanacetum coccineum]
MFGYRWKWFDTGAIWQMMIVLQTGFMAFSDSEGYFTPNLICQLWLEEFQQLEYEGYGPKTSKNVYKDTSNEVRESPDVPMVENLVSDDKLEKIVFPTVAKIEFVRPKQQEKPVRKPVKVITKKKNQVLLTVDAQGT